MKQSEISQLETKVSNYLSSSIKTGDVRAQVKSFFENTRALAAGGQASNAQASDETYMQLVLGQYRQVEELAKAFKDFETHSAEAFLSLAAYLSAVNALLKDSRKLLHFDDDRGRLVFSFMDTEGRSAVENREIAYLSSGEQQILTLFTFLAFSASKNSIFIVDEPELSLHPKWQHDFMTQFLSLKSPDVQVLLATHSPDIVGRYKSACIALEP